MLRFPPPTPDLGQWSYEGLLWQKKPIVNWFLNELFTTHTRDREPGRYYLSLGFPKGVTIQVNAVEYTATEIGCFGELLEARKRKWISWTGDAYFDWEKSAIQIPGGAPLISTGVETDLTLWEDFEGAMPTAPTGSEIVVVAHGFQVLPSDAVIPDLMSLGPTRTITPVVQ